MKKIKCFIDKDKEQSYINSMADQGWAFTGLKYMTEEVLPIALYCFDECEADKYAYRLILMYEKNEQEVWEYSAKLEDEGVETVQLRENWLYLRGQKSAAMRMDDIIEKDYLDVSEYYADMSDGYISGAILFFVMSACWVWSYLKKAGLEPIIMAFTGVFAGAMMLTTIVAAVKCKFKAKAVSGEQGEEN